ncbi:hypothetical protein T4E_9834 [Trichinella pseudospiralis]|uniref:Uncharacterized protein n=1 Tax=Trichinella pseudospiralis TaxID=6337 RepID=A0A0V0YHD7_TRIPS|nr:hypothetical protein T4E_9834 [Trichinella pseudospiralis]
MVLNSQRNGRLTEMTRMNSKVQEIAHKRALLFNKVDRGHSSIKSNKSYAWLTQSVRVVCRLSTASSHKNLQIIKRKTGGLAWFSFLKLQTDNSLHPFLHVVCVSMLFCKTVIIELLELEKKAQMETVQAVIKQACSASTVRQVVSLPRAHWSWISVVPGGSASVILPTNCRMVKGDDHDQSCKPVNSRLWEQRNADFKTAPAPGGLTLVTLTCAVAWPWPFYLCIPDLIRKRHDC